MITWRLYLVSPAVVAGGKLATLVPDLADAGVDVVQLREKDMEAGDLLRAGEPLRDECRRSGIAFVVNDRPDVALALDADGVHLGQNDLPVGIARRIVPHAVVGRSTHSRTDIAAETAARSRPDYIAVGPVYATPTKPGRPATGLDLVRHAAATVDMPWFAIGGIDHDNVPAVVDAGARRIVVVRAITEAPDPPAAAARLRAVLDAAAL